MLTEEPPEDNSQDTYGTRSPSNDGLGRVLTYVYCGMKYPQDTPSWGNQVLTDHIKVCEKHPMRDLELKYKKVRKALSDMVGADTKAELDGMEMTLRMAHAPDKDKAIFINAIDALRDTLEP